MTDWMAGIRLSSPCDVALLPPDYLITCSDTLSFKTQQVSSHPDVLYQGCQIVDGFLQVARLREKRHIVSIRPTGKRAR